MAKSKHRGLCRRLSAPVSAFLALAVCLFLKGINDPERAVNAAAREDHKPALGIENALFLDLPSVGACEGVTVLRPLSPIEAGGYTASPLAEGFPVSEALCTLGKALALCPEGFFAALTEGTGGLVFALTGGIRAEGGMPRPAGFTSDRDGGVLIVLDVSKGLSTNTVFHELCHAIDRRIAASEREKSESRFEESWLALCPRGFSYYYSYTDVSGAPYSDSASPAFTAEEAGGVYFINRYSKTYPTEDRAVLFETLMRAVPEAPYMRSPHIIMKLDYYFAAIRFYLDPEGEWTEPTFWEERLYALLK